MTGRAPDTAPGASTNNVRALYTAASTGRDAPYASAHIKVFYPSGVPGSTPAERGSGIIAADPTLAPFPVVVFLNPVNIGPEYYRWVGTTLARRGFVTATFSWIEEARPGMEALLPGPQGFAGGDRRPAAAVPVIVGALTKLHHGGGPLAGLLDLDHVVVGGHSAGGSVALQAASAAHHPKVRAVFAANAHNAAPVESGAAPGTVLPLPSDCPVLLIGGTRDGVIDKSRFRYGLGPDDEWQPVQRTFTEAMTGGRGDLLLAMVEGANHFSFADPDDDTTTGRAFLDEPATTPGPAVREYLGELIGSFLDRYVHGRSDADSGLAAALGSRHLARVERK